MKNTFLNFVNRFFIVKDEEHQLINFINIIKKHSNHEITLLDIGCGYGQKMNIIKNLDIKVVGVDVNDKIVEANKSVGFNCLSIDEFRNSDQQYSVLLMSHVIEHFQPNDLLFFIDNYLKRLEENGFIIISTPLNSPYFYDDFDHIKPYHPTSINMVFCDHDSQVQYHSKYKLEMVDLWFRKEPFKLKFIKSLYIRSYKKAPVILCNLILVFIFYLSGRFIGRTDGWMGLYRKVSS